MNLEEGSTFSTKIKVFEEFRFGSPLVSVRDEMGMAFIALAWKHLGVNSI